MVYEIGLPGIEPFKELIGFGSLLQGVDELRILPTCWAHWDINVVNIMVTDDRSVSGILDWEEAYWMLFGMNSCRLSDLAAWNRCGVLSKKPFSDETEIAFWKSLFQAAPEAVRDCIKEIQLARILDTLSPHSSMLPIPPTWSILVFLEIQ